jgi:hypothetical protein
MGNTAIQLSQYCNVWQQDQQLHASLGFIETTIPFTRYTGYSTLHLLNLLGDRHSKVRQAYRSLDEKQGPFTRYTGYSTLYL